jgi:hypothetical protein
VPPHAAMRHYRLRSSSYAFMPAIFNKTILFQ